MNSIKKGHRFEREIANWLTKQTGVKWHRVPLSGGTATSQNLQNWHGDLFCEDHGYKDIVVECKSYKKPVMLADITNPKSLLNEWIEQTKKEAGNHFWMLFFKANRGPVFLAVVPTTDTLRYATDATLKNVFAQCKGVCRTNELIFFQISDSNSSI